ncbi:hypothetical protein O9993_19470 [Vibrio lentus]|nr:hypothetical protein [Vibrio lentus]
MQTVGCYQGADFKQRYFQSSTSIFSLTKSKIFIKRLDVAIYYGAEDSAYASPAHRFGENIFRYVCRAMLLNTTSLRWLRVVTPTSLIHALGSDVRQR